MEDLTPKEIVENLDKHIVGQKSAKRAVAIALRNRWRRAQLEKRAREEITPKNILMIGPTGVGKTEIARRLARLVEAPFVKIEATKFTEVGYVGRDVESIIRDLTEVSVSEMREKAIKQVEKAARDIAEERVLDAILPRSSGKKDEVIEKDDTRQQFRKMLREQALDEREIEVELAIPALGVEIMAPPGMEEMTNQLQSMFTNFSGQKSKRRKLKVKEAFRLMCEEEADKLINEDDIRSSAIENVEQNGIVFLDEIDKIVRHGSSGPDVSREGVQRDLLPLVEGCTVNTKYGLIKTDHILFIGSGAFHLAKPSDLIPELQGRLPNRVELDQLTVEDFVLILTEPDFCLSEQYTALLKTENFTLNFSSCGIRKIAECAYEINQRNENIGARRLHTIMEKLLEEVSFSAPDGDLNDVLVDAKFVDLNIGQLLEKDELTKYVL
tara:strand:- start:23652 stop:24971 length:1320 start_codon:yes stop_codon:yes gene_type:complete